MIDELTPDSPLSPPETFWKRHWQKLLAAAIWLVIAGSILGYATFTGRSPTEIIADLLDLLRTPIGPLLYILIYTLRPLAFFSALVVTLLGGAIWGPVWGTLFVVIGANLSASVAYVFGRVFGQGVLPEEQHASDTLINQYARRMRRNAFMTVLIMRLVFLPYDLVNYLAGFLRISYQQFITATILGSLPGTLTFVLAGASLNIDDIIAGRFGVAAINPWSLLASVVLFVSGIAVSRLLRQREQL